MPHAGSTADGLALAIGAGRRHRFGSDGQTHRGLDTAPMFATPAPLQTVLWRAGVMAPQGHSEAFYSPFDGGRPMRFEAFASDATLREPLQSIPLAARVMRFNDGFHRLERVGDLAFVTDLRMGQEPYYVFRFSVARRDASGRWLPVQPEAFGNRGDVARALRWLWARMWGADIASPK